MKKEKNFLFRVLRILLAVSYFSFQILFLTQCTDQKETSVKEKLAEDEDSFVLDPSQMSFDSISEELQVNTILPKSELELSIINAGLTNVEELDSTIQVDLKYSSTDNFVKLDLYGALEDCYLQSDIALKLVKAQKLLKERYPNYSLIVFDAVRPLSVQRVLWDTIKVPSKIKHFYVSHPDSGSIHNYGAAVDLSIVDSLKQELDMGTPFDHFGTLAYPIREMELLKEGKLTKEQVNNRLILRNVMLDAGFTSITTEWWHFNGCSRARAERVYKIVE